LLCNVAEAARLLRTNRRHQANPPLHLTLSVGLPRLSGVYARAAFSSLSAGNKSRASSTRSK